MLKLLALLFMITDHLGVFFFDNNLYMRIIGRFAFPLFAYMLVVGEKNTKNIFAYIYRLAILAIISQLPFMLLGYGGLNIIFTLLIGLVYLRLSRMMPDESFIILLFALVAAQFLRADYGAFGILLIWLYSEKFDEKFDSKKQFLFCNALIHLGAVFALDFPIYQLASFFAFPLFRFSSRLAWLPSRLYYLAYPLHFILILVYV